MKDNIYQAVLTDLALVSDVLAELSFCSSQTNCKSVGCKCNKDNLTCTVTCSFSNCEKCDENFDITGIDFDFEDDDFRV